MVALGAVAMAFLAALGAWLFSLISPVLDRPFKSEQLQVYVDDSEKDCDSYALPAALLEDVPVVEVEDGTPVQLAAFDGEWIVAHDGIPTATRTMQLTLHGSGDEAVVIHDIEVVDFESLTPEDEIVVIHECLQGGSGGDMGSPMDVRSLAVDFSGRPPDLDFTDPALRFPYQVSRDDPEVFDVYVEDRGEVDEQECFCRWNIGITWSAGEDLQHAVVEGDSIGVATAIPPSEWQEFWWVDGEWTTDPAAE